MCANDAKSIVEIYRVALRVLLGLGNHPFDCHDPREPESFLGERVGLERELVRGAPRPQAMGEVCSLMGSSEPSDHPCVAKCSLLVREHEDGVKVVHYSFQVLTGGLGNDSRDWPSSNRVDVHVGSGHRSFLKSFRSNQATTIQ